MIGPAHTVMVSSKSSLQTSQDPPRRARLRYDQLSFPLELHTEAVSYILVCIQRLTVPTVASLDGSPKKPH